MQLGFNSPERDDLSIGQDVAWYDHQAGHWNTGIVTIKTELNARVRTSNNQRFSRPLEALHIDEGQGNV